MIKYRKKPVVIDAVRWDGQVSTILPFSLETTGIPPGIDNASRRLSINTLEGVMVAELGDWIIRGVKGELYPCKPDIFEMTYELVNPDA